MNKTQKVVLAESVLAAVDLQARRFCGLDGNVCAAGAKALGVVDADTGAGNMAPANVLGTILIHSGGPITAGAEVQSDGEGRAVAKTDGLANGVAWDAATGADELIRIVRGI